MNYWEEKAEQVENVKDRLLYIKSIIDTKKKLGLADKEILKNLKEIIKDLESGEY